MNHENKLVQKPTAPPTGVANLMKTYLKGFTEIFRNPCSRWTIFAGCLRFWAGNAVGYYTGRYFNIYPDNVVSFNTLSFSLQSLINFRLTFHI